MKSWTERYTAEELIVHHTDTFVIANKPPGVPVQADRSGDLDILTYVRSVVGGKLHLLGRLDRPVSGVVLIAKSDKYPDDLQKTYRAIVSPLKVDTGVCHHYTKRDGRTHKALISDDARPGYKKALLRYQKVRSLDHYDVVDIWTETGRYHQIRAQLAHIGSPIKGDVKYGARRGHKDRSIDLHAYRVSSETLGWDIAVPPIGRDDMWAMVCYT